MVRPKVTRTGVALLYLSVPHKATLDGNSWLSYELPPVISVDMPYLSMVTQGRKQRNPLLLFLLLGLFLFRVAERKFSLLVLFQEPPRKVSPSIPTYQADACLCLF
jgi:hypothetical protein